MICNEGQEVIKEFISLEYEKNRVELRKMVNEILDIARKEQGRFDELREANLWFHFFNSAINKTGSIELSEKLADEAFDKFNEKFPKTNKQGGE